MTEKKSEGSKPVINGKKALEFIFEYLKEEEKAEQDQMRDTASKLNQQKLASQLEIKTKMQREIIGVVLEQFHWEIPEIFQHHARFSTSANKDMLQVSADCRQLFIQEEDYFFRTFFGSKPLTEGIHYWEIIADARTEHELKIGISTEKDRCDQKKAFCDYAFGWAFFGIGQLRHNSNAQGKEYGKSFKR